MNTIIEKIRAEIERLKIGREGFRDAETESELSAFYNGQVMILDEVLAKLSDLEKEEKPMNEIEEIIEKELERYARENWEFNEVLRKEVPFDVEDCKWCDLVAFARHFAQWQKEHDAELIEIAYNDGITIGKTKQKEQLMKEAVEGRVVDAGIFATYNTPVEYTHSGDKVKLIIVKED